MINIASSKESDNFLFMSASSGMGDQSDSLAGCQEHQLLGTGASSASGLEQQASQQFHHNYDTINQSGPQDGYNISSGIFQQSLSDNLQTIMNNSVVSYTKNYYQWLHTLADPRVESWPMMSSPFPTLGLFFLYLIVSNYGPGWMKARKPLELRWLLVFYNLYIAILNLWITCEVCYCSYKLNYRSFCQLVKVSDDPYVMRIANAIWWYYASKGIEFADTLFFILRKKDRQLTFLHKYHHSSMFIVWWTAVRFVPGGSAITPVVFNSFVHVLMYTYYGLSALGPKVQKFLWWKRYLTIIQLIQFFVGVSIGIHLITSGCQFTRWMQYVFSGYAFSFIILFGNFYLNEYSKKKQQNEQDKQKNGLVTKPQVVDSAKIKQT
uniref:Elongation of very long chain fatty acids protein n=1 Tax=Aceria tosichella TaxID=561515 RepID=A0A6G1S7P6_9ACAR